MTETSATYQVEQAIAGWENIEEWSLNPRVQKPKRVFQVTNKRHPELGIFYLANYIPTSTGYLKKTRLHPRICKDRTND